MDTGIERDLHCYFSPFGLSSGFVLCDIYISDRRNGRNMLLYYIWLHLQFVREHENDLKAQQRIQIMMSQIQPHFMYNTLATIQALCLSDPQKAFDTTALFSAYLRDNIDSLSKSDLIPVHKELQHTKIYTDIEMIRYTSFYTMSRIPKCVHLFSEKR